MPRWLFKTIEIVSYAIGIIPDLILIINRKRRRKHEKKTQDETMETSTEIVDISESKETYCKSKRRQRRIPSLK